MMNEKQEAALRLAQRITDYLAGGGLYNPELADHGAVRDLLIDCREALTEQPAQVDPCIDGSCSCCWTHLDEQPAPVAKPHEQQEPVAYIRKDQLQKAAQSPMLCEVTPEPRQDRIGIYTSPPASKPWAHVTTWRGLTDEQIAPIIQQYHWLPTAFARAIEAKLRELNEHKEKNA